MRTRNALPIALISLVATWAGSASADVAASTGTQAATVTRAANVSLVASGATRGRLDGEMRLRYPGFEQTTVVSSRNNIILITMEAVQEKGLAPVQISCSSYELRPDGPPRLVVDLKRLTAYSNGERAANHPKAAADGKGNIVWMYGSDYNNNRPNTYAGIINEKCEHLSAPQMVSIPRDANDGAPDIAYLGNGQFIGGYYSDGGGDAVGFPQPGGDYTVAMMLTVKEGGLLPTLERTWIKDVVTPTQIGRPTVAAAGPGRALLCAPKGPNRPSDSIECGLLDTTTGTVVFKAELAKGDQKLKKYYNQPTVVQLSDNKFALMAIESNGQGKQTNNVKGSNLSHLFLLEKNGDSLTVGGEIAGAAAHQTHASICTGTYGEAGGPAVAVFSAAPTGIGRAAMAMVGFDEGAKAFKYDEKADLWPAAWYGDSGHLSNWYGRNPMRQGRDFMRCIGGVQNPGYHVANGFMPDVKTLFVGAVHGRVPGDAKNSLFLSLVPGQMDKKELPQNPVNVGDTSNPDPNADPNANGGGNASDSGGGCSTTGSSGGGLSALLGLAGVALIVSRRRGKR